MANKNSDSVLSLEIIRSYNFPERTHKPDWDDTAIVFTLPNGIELETLTQCGNEPCDSDALEGLGGYIYITTKEELDVLVRLSYDEVMIKTSLENDGFPLSHYL